MAKIEPKKEEVQAKRASSKDRPAIERSGEDGEQFVPMTRVHNVSPFPIMLDRQKIMPDQRWNGRLLMYNTLSTTLNKWYDEGIFKADVRV